MYKSKGKALGLYTSDAARDEFRKLYDADALHFGSLKRSISPRALRNDVPRAVLNKLLKRTILFKAHNSRAP